MLPIVYGVVHAEGVSTNRPGEYFECRHEHHVIACHYRAHGNYISGTEHLQVRSPYMGLLPAGELDANGLLGQFRMIWCKFLWDGLKSDTGERVSLSLGESRVHRSHVRNLASAEVPVVLKKFRELQNLQRRPDLSSQFRASALIVELLATWAELPVQSGGDERAVRLYQSLIEQHAEHSDVALSSLAERIGYTPDHLGELFHKELAMTPVAYRTQIRLQRARELLSSTPMPISEIARDAGFPDANYFARIFRRSYGISPRDFARKSGAQNVRAEKERVAER
jgi:AraC-like DNA-binding protein